jgi:pre-mRNA-splicing factor CWC26
MLTLAVVIGKDVATFQKSKSAWATVGSSALPVHAPPVVKPDEAGPSSATGLSDADLATDQLTAPVKQVTKRKGGLRTAAQMKAEEERLAAERSPSPTPDEGAPDPTKTVHRDASGRIVDIEALKAEEKRLEDEERRKEREREEWTKGLVQRRQREERAMEEREMGERDVARWVNSPQPPRLDALLDARVRDDPNEPCGSLWSNTS